MTTKTKNTRTIAGSLGIFFIFIIPLLIIPGYVNKQTLEHRLYLPIVGILLLLPQTDFFKNAADRKLLVITGAVCVLFAALNMMHQRNFADPVTFWTQAVETSPNSALANLSLATRTDNVAEADAYYRKAYDLDSTLTNINFYMAEMLADQDSVLAAEPYLLAEKRLSGYYRCDFLLARVAIVKRDIPRAIGYLESYLKVDSMHVQANYNLYTLYLQTQQPDMATQQANNCIRRFQYRLREAPADKITNSALLNIYFKTNQAAKAKEQLKYMQQQGIQLPNEFIPASMVQQIMVNE